MTRIFLLVLLFSIGFASTADAQRKQIKKRKSKTKTKTAVITTPDGSQLRGEIVKMTDDSLVLDTEQFGRLGYLRDDVQYVIDSRGNKAIKRSGNKYFLNTSAFPVEETYYENSMIFLNTVGFRLNKHLSASVSIEPFTSIIFKGFNGGVSLKGTLQLGKKWHGALGANVISTFFGRKNSLLVLSPFATFTYGDINRHFSSSVRLLTQTQDSQVGFGFSLSGQLPISRRFSLVGEFNALGSPHATDDNPYILTFGAKKHPTSGETTYSYGIIVDLNNRIPFPYFSFSTPIF